MSNHSSMRLGKRPRRNDVRTLKLGRYLKVTGPTLSVQAPAHVDYTRGLRDFGVMLNDRLGCCTIAAVGHAVQIWKLSQGGGRGQPGVGPTPGWGSSELGVGNKALKVSSRRSGREANPLMPTCQAAGHSETGIGPNPETPAPNSLFPTAKSFYSQAGGGSEELGVAENPSPNSPLPTPYSLLTIPDSTNLEYYGKWDGYDPANPASDQGGVELDVLNQWRQQGFDGHPLDAYAAIELGTRDTGNGIPEDLLRAAIWLFGGCYIGLELPLTAQGQDVWYVASGKSGVRSPKSEASAYESGVKVQPRLTDDPSDPGSWGGHAVYLVGYDFPESAVGVSDSGLRTPDPSFASATLTCVTWGRPKQMTWAFFAKYCSEAYALVSKDWLNARGVSPGGFDLVTLEQDLKAVSG